MSQSAITAQFRRSGGDAPFGELSLTLLLFISRLHRQLREQGACEVSFLAREGHFLKELFDVYQRIVVPVPEHVPSRYLLVSRRALYSPSLPEGENTFRFLREHYPEISVPGFMNSLGIDEVCETDLEGAADTACPATVDSLVRSTEFQSRFAHHRRNQRALVEQYLEPAISASNGHLHIVDVGWKGSMQDFLERILSPSSDISGWYLGLNRRTSAVGSMDTRKHGLIFDTGPPTSRFFNVFAHFKSLYETLLNADHASVVRYSLTNGAVEPVLDPLNDELAQHRALVRPLQEKIREIFVTILLTTGRESIDSPQTERWVARHHSRMIFRPRKNEVSLVDRLRHYENFGEVSMVERGRTRRSNGPQIHSMGQLLRGPRSLYGGSWPPLELERQGLGWLIRPIGMIRSARELSRGTTLANRPTRWEASLPKPSGTRTG